MRKKFRIFAHINEEEKTVTMTKVNKVLFITQEIAPYLPDSEMSLTGRNLPSAIQERGREIRTFMPKWGNINERRNQLHEVIRLSGMNLIIDDTDHPLIIKVASIQSTRMQVYFIDNDDYFMNRLEATDENGNEYEDNDERAIFYARGVLETVKKLRWQPDIVHCHGWFSSVVPIYLRHVFADDPIFKNVKIVVSLYDDAFEGELNPQMRKKIENEGVKDKKLDFLDHPSYQNLMKLVIDYADGIVVETTNLDPIIAQHLAQSNKNVLPYVEKESAQYLDNYENFYDQLL